MRTLLVNPPWFLSGHYGVRAGSRWPHFNRGSVSEGGYLPFPFYLAYATAVLEQAGKNVRAFDAIAEGWSEEEFLQKVREYFPDLVVMEVATPSLVQDLRTAERLKRELDGVKIVFCGLHNGLSSPEFLRENPVVDFTMFGEYEYTLLELVDTLESGGDLSNVRGISFRKGSSVEVNQLRPLIENLDELPWPARHHFPMMRYNDCPFLPTPSLMMWASRGCPYGCIFCCWPQIMYASRKYRARNPRLVVDEMVTVAQEYGYKSVYFDDDTFNIGDRRMEDFALELKRRRFYLPWGMMARADTISKATLRILREAGLTVVKYGIESGSQALVDAANKNLDLEKAREMVKFTKSLGIKVHLTFTFGLPGETWETIKRTINFALELDPDSVQWSICTPYPGTKYFQEAVDKGFISFSSWEDFAADKAVVRTENLSWDELCEALQMAEEAWAYRRGYWDYLFKDLSWRRVAKGLLHPRRVLKWMTDYHRLKRAARFQSL